jgi:hypothetical protein
MRYKASLAAVVATALAVPAAMAAAPPGKGKPSPTGPGCKPNVTVILKGKLMSDPGLGATSFLLQVTRANNHGKSLLNATAPLSVTIAVDSNTKIRRQGKKTIDALALNDRAVVQLRRCKADLPLSTGTVDDVAASRVTAQAPKPSSP